jgi:oligopeptide transport system substrate-binding protein
VKWSDGARLRAQDFVYSWNRLLSPATAAAYAYLLFDIENAEAFNQGKVKDFHQVGVKALDDLTLQVKLNQPVSHWHYIPTFWVTFPLREDVVKKYGSKWESPGKMVTLGPYLLSSRELESKIEMKKNPTYYGEAGNVDRVVGQIIQDDSTALNLYESGRLDFLTDLSTMDLKRLQGRADLKTFPYLKTSYLGFVSDKEPTARVHLRRAIAMAIDKSKITDLLHGSQQAAQSFVPPGVMGYSKEIGLRYDPVQAKKELQASGLSSGQSIKIDLTALNWDKTLILAQYIQGELKKNLGIDVTLQAYDNKTYRARLNTLSHQTFLTSWSADYPDPDNILSIFLSQSGNNHTAWKNLEFDKSVILARHSLNKKVREKTYFQLQKQLLQEQSVIVPLFYESIQALLKSRVHQLELNPVNYLNLKKVKLDD